MPEIIPAILTSDKGVFKEQVEQAAAFGAQTVQVDFTDGVFVSSKTLMPDDLDSFVMANSNLTFEAHLMAVNPEEHFATLYALGFKRIAVHYKSLKNIQQTIDLAKDLDVEFGMALNPEVGLEYVDEYIDQLDFILFLTVVPGEQGHPFVKQVLEKIHAEELHQLKHQHKNIMIEVDGGVKMDNIKAVAQAGAERIVVGSGIWQSPDPAEAFRRLTKEAN